MAKLKKDAITADDLREFVEADSDFGFEMRVLKELRSAGFSCSHSGTYRDPVTDKVRQYDIRAERDRGDLTLALAVECKNLRPNNPLLLSCVPRNADEAFHDLILFRSFNHFASIEAQAVLGDRSPYKVTGVVAKKTDQVGREEHSREITSNDEATFEKLNQAVNSARDLVRRFALKTSPPNHRAIVPVLIIPAGLLWQVDYDGDGKVTANPRPVKSASFFLNHSWSGDTPFGLTLSYRLSHIEIVTFDAIGDTLKAWLCPDGFLYHQR